MTDTWKIELIPFPVTDVDRAKEFYTRIGFNADHDSSPYEGLRFVQLTPPGSACSICIGTGITEMTPGTQTAQIVVPSAQRAYEHLRSLDVDCTEPVDEGWGLFVYFTDPDGNTWSLQQLPDYAANA